MSKIISYLKSKLNTIKNRVLDMLMGPKEDFDY